MIHTLTKTAAVVVSSTILATLAVNAADMHGRALTTYLGAMLLGAPEHRDVPCAPGMVPVDDALVPFCVDVYEASPGEGCPYDKPRSQDETNLNIADQDCMPASVPNTHPWTNVTQPQAALLCERAGKQLLSPGAWYVAARGTPDSAATLNEEQCNISANRADGPALTGSGMRCVSDTGAYDMIGNVWEWVDGAVMRGVWDDVPLPPTGYVQGVDMHGMPRVTGSAADERFGGDRLWSDTQNDTGILRGGYYGSGSNAGIYAVYAASPLSFYAAAAGFRCARAQGYEE
jgi:formylglycine-generating enzyme required for sulfatase activity